MSSVAYLFSLFFFYLIILSREDVTDFKFAPLEATFKNLFEYKMYRNDR